MSYYSNYYVVDEKAKYKHFWKYFANVSGLVLDIGCTTGNFIQWSPETIIGVDLDRPALEFSAKRGFKVNCIDINQGLCFADESFDAVNCSAVLEHVEKPRILMQEIWRVLRPNGKAVILVPDIKRLGFDYWRDYTHITPFTKEGLRRVAIDGGFRQFQVNRYIFNYLKYLPHSGGIRTRVWLDRFEKVIAFFLSKDLILVALKKGMHAN